MMTTQSLTHAAPAAPAAGRWRSRLTQETVATVVVSVIVAAAVILPLLVLVISSFQVMDVGGFETEWGLDNYRYLFTDRIFAKAFVNTLIVCIGATAIATFLGVTLAWINARTNTPGRDRLQPYNLISFFFRPFARATPWPHLPGGPP